MISGDGRFVAFRSDATNLVPHETNEAVDVFVRDRLNGATERVNLTSRGKQADYEADPFLFEVAGVAISADGRFVAFTLAAPNLGAGGCDQEGDCQLDVFVRDRQEGRT